MRFTPDPRWSVFVHPNTYGSYQQNILPDFYLKKDVPLDVKENFLVIKDLCSGKLITLAAFIYFSIDKQIIVQIGITCLQCCF